MPATMSEIAQEVGISVTMVSRVVREDPTLRISEDRRRDILGAIDRMGGVKVRKYSRKPRALSHIVMVPMNRKYSGKTAETGLYFTETEEFRQFEETLKSEGFSVHVTFFTPDEDRQVIESLIRSDGKCDALLLLSGVANEGLAELILASKFPHVCDEAGGERFELNCVRVNAAEGIRKAVGHLCELGHRRIGFLGDRGFYRYPLVVGALAEMGLPIDERHNCWSEKADTTGDEGWRKLGCAAFERWLDQGGGATALMCRNDRLAFGAIEAMEARGMVVGKDISIVGYDNIEERDYGEKNGRLTTIDNPRDIVGRRSGQLLLNQLLRWQQDIITELVPTKLIVRKTTGPCLDGV